MKSWLLLVLLLIFSSALAETPYDKLRKDLKGDSRPTSSHISDPPVDPDQKPLSLQEQQEEADAECKGKENSPNCFEYRRVGRTRYSVEKNACDSNPLGKRCQAFRDYALKKLLHRQSACRSGLGSKKCSSVRAGARSSGDLER